ncbi:hypothetical protein LCGC14_1196480 [marine sediment metagenome]|uniref:Uncharacterized protein n=1 Tax=marine sediment metagenome TaxID=412755 RepID=A0A0F9P0I7_9ZZZZ
MEIYLLIFRVLVVWVIGLALFKRRKMKGVTK